MTTELSSFLAICGLHAGQRGGHRVDMAGSRGVGRRSGVSAARELLRWDGGALMNEFHGDRPGQLTVESADGNVSARECFGAEPRNRAKSGAFRPVRRSRDLVPPEL